MSRESIVWFELDADLMKMCLIQQNKGPIFESAAAQFQPLQGAVTHASGPAHVDQTLMPPEDISVYEKGFASHFECDTVMRREW